MTDHRLLVISSIGCGPPYMGNRMRMRTLLAECRNLGLVIHFAGIEMSAEERAATLPWVDRWVADFKPGRRSRLRRLRDAILRRMPFGRRNHGTDGADSVDRWMAPHWVDKARRLQRAARYTRVLVPYVFHSAFLEAFSYNTRRILDTHDKFAGRKERLAEAGISDYWFTTTEAEERRAAKRADVVLTIQSHEAAYFVDLLGGSGVVREVGHFTPQLAAFCADRQRTSHQIGILASSNPLNVDALVAFLSDVWPVIYQRHPQATLRIAGDVCSRVGEVPANVELLGPIADITEFYRTCVCTVNAMRTGTGLKIKTLESLAHGCPVVGTPTAAEGLETCEGNGLVIATDATGMAEALIHWLRCPAAAAAAGHAARHAAEGLNARWKAELAAAMAVQ